jgi:hypothetical protein
MKKVFLLFLPVLYTFANYPALAGQPMKCVDGSGRVVYTELSSCSEALRAAPHAPKSKLTVLREQEKKAQEDLAKARLNRELVRQEFKDKARRLEVDSDYRERQRLMAEEEQRQQECARMKIESDRRYKDAMTYGGDAWWKNRSEAYDQEMELKCGRQIGLR